MPTREVPVLVDVENTISVPFVTGIQRVARQVLGNAAAFERAGLRVIPVVHCRYCRGWRRLSPSEHRRLATTSFRARRDTLPTRARQLAVRAAPSAMRRLGAVRRYLQHRRWHEPLRLGSASGDDRPGPSVFLDLDSSWHNPQKRYVLLGALRAAGIPIVTVHYDIIPVLFPSLVHPETGRRFLSHLDAHLEHSSLFLCISESSRRDLLEHAVRDTGRQAPPAEVITLGADHLAGATGTRPLAAWPRLRRYLLCVGTLEPRKDHLTAIRAFDRVAAKHPDLGLVLAGKPGWNADRLTADIRGHPLFNDRLIWLQSASDPDIATLYHHAFLVLVPSLYEGFGLPVSEALAAGTPVLTTGAGALREAGGELVEYFEAGDDARLGDLIKRHLEDSSHHEALVERVRRYRATPWSRTSEQVAAGIVRLLGQRRAFSGGRTAR